MTKRILSDPMERIISEALEAAGMEFVCDGDPGTGTLAKGLDFRLENDVFVEVKRMHSPRIAEQMSRAENVIAVQGPKAVAFMAALLKSGGRL